MKTLSFGAVLKAAVIAGLVAGLLISIFHFALTEPVIDQAIALEETLNHAQSEHEAEVVSRPGQKAGLFLGFAFYGLSWALLLSVVFHIAQSRFEPLGLRRAGMLFAGLVFWAAVLVPFLKYPANPPGVGEPESIAFRQNSYLLMLVLSLAGTLAALALGRLAARRWRGVRAWQPALAGMIAVALALYLGMPENPDPLRMPAELVLRFRLLSIAGLALFWALFGLGFGWLLQHSAERKPAPTLAVRGV